MHGVHGGFGPGVGESPLRQAETAGKLAGIPDSVLRRLREMGTAAYPVADRGDDRRVRMAGDGRAVTAVHVDVLGAVDVVHLRPGAVTHPHCLWLGDLPVRGRATGQMLSGQCDEFGAARLAAQEDLLLFSDQGVDVAPNRSCDRRRCHENLHSVARSTWEGADRTNPD